VLETFKVQTSAYNIRSMAKMGAHTCTDASIRPSVKPKRCTKRSAPMRCQQKWPDCDVLKSTESEPSVMIGAACSRVLIGNQRDVAKKVAFETTMRVHPTLHVNDYTDAELNASWYSPSEYKTIKSQIQLILSKFDQVEHHFRPNFSRHTDARHPALRGLESLTKSGAIAKKLRRQEAIGGVLAEQRRQYEQYGEIRDFHRLANVFSEYTQISNRVARRLGITDEQETIREHQRWDPIHGPSSSKAPPMLYSHRHVRVFPLKDRQRNNFTA
jgi:hypothetical protein